MSSRPSKSWSQKRSRDRRDPCRRHRPRRSHADRANGASYWANLKLGVSGIGPITLAADAGGAQPEGRRRGQGFRPAQAFRGAADFDARPRFAIRGGGGARSDRAMRRSPSTCRLSMRTAAIVGTGVGGQTTPGRQLIAGSIAEKGTRVYPLTIPKLMVECAGEPGFHGMRVARAGLRGGERLRLGDPCHRPCVPYGARRAGRLRGDRRRGSLHHLRHRCAAGRRCA